MPSRDDKQDERNKMSKVKGSSTRQSRRSPMVVTALALTACLLQLPNRMHAEEHKPMIMFVQIADNMMSDPTTSTLRLVNVAQQTLYFADRPERIAGHINIAAFLNEWTSKAGANNFGSDPPNAALSVSVPGKAKDTLAIIKISNPHVEGNDLLYSYEIIEGNLPNSGGATSLFIDWIKNGFGFDYQQLRPLE